MIDGEDLFPDNWIYIHEPVGPRRPDPELPLVEPVDGARTSPRPASASSTSASRATSCGRWSDEALVELAKRELDQLGLVAPEKVERGFVTRVPLAYPMYDADYGERVDAIRGWLEGVSNLQQVGRNGLHRYNNSDHSMLTAIRAVDNIAVRRRTRHLGGQRRVRLPRGGRQGRAPVQAGARDALDARAARLRGLSVQPSSGRMYDAPGFWCVSTLGASPGGRSDGPNTASPRTDFTDDRSGGSSRAAASFSASRLAAPDLHPALHAAGVAGRVPRRDRDHERRAAVAPQGLQELLRALARRAQPHDRAAAAAQRGAHALELRLPARAVTVTRQASSAVSGIRGVARRPTRPLRASRIRTRGEVRSGTAGLARRGSEGACGSGGGGGRSTQAPRAPSWMRSTLPGERDDVEVAAGVLAEGHERRAGWGVPSSRSSVAREPAPGRTSARSPA